MLSLSISAVQDVVANMPAQVISGYHELIPDFNAFTATLSPALVQKIRATYPI